MVKKMLGIGTVLAASMLIASCSNDMQPLSVDSNTENKITAAISDLSIRDMGWAGGQLWAVTTKATGPTTIWHDTVRAPISGPRLHRITDRNAVCQIAENAIM